MRYEDRTEDERVRATIKALASLDAEEAARYIVQLEMRLESLGHLEHFEVRQESDSD